VSPTRTSTPAGRSGPSSRRTRDAEPIGTRGAPSP
jgi:hypothetical protein